MQSVKRMHTQVAVKSNRSRNQCDILKKKRRHRIRLWKIYYGRFIDQQVAEETEKEGMEYDKDTISGILGRYKMNI